MLMRLTFAFFIALLSFFVPTSLSGRQTTNPQETSKSATPTSQSPGAPKASPNEGGAQAKTPRNISAKENVSATAWKMLEAGIASDKTRSRSDAVSALSVLNSHPKAISLLTGRMQDKDVSIRVLAATSLGEMKARPAISALKKSLDDPSVEVSFAAAQALWKMSDRSGRDIFYAVLSGERKTTPGLIQTKVRTAKQEMRDPKALALIGVNEASGAFLGPFSMGVSMLEEYAKNTSAPVQAVCAKLLAMDDSRETTEELEDVLWDKNWAVRAAAARALAKLNDRKAVKHLIEIMESDPQESARLVAAAAIIRLGGGRGVAAHRPAPPASIPEAPAKDQAAKPI